VSFFVVVEGVSDFLLLESEDDEDDEDDEESELPFGVPALPASDEDFFG
jgi:hypothetical protein